MSEFKYLKYNAMELRYFNDIVLELKNQHYSIRAIMENIEAERDKRNINTVRYFMNEKILRDIVMELKNMNYNLKAILKNMEAEREDKLKEKHEHSEDQIS